MRRIPDTDWSSTDDDDRELQSFFLLLDDCFQLHVPRRAACNRQSIIFFSVPFLFSTSQLLLAANSEIISFLRYGSSRFRHSGLERPVGVGVKITCEMI